MSINMVKKGVFFVSESRDYIFVE